MSSWKSLNDSAAPAFWLNEECLPDITLLDDTCGSPFPGSMPATPITARSMNSRSTPLQASQLSSSTDLNSTAQIPCPQKKTLDLPKSNLSRPKAESQTFDTKPSRQTGTETLSETSSSNGAQENYSEVHSQHNRTASTDPEEKMVDLSESMYAPMRWLDDRYFPEITLLDVTRESEVSHDGELSSMEVTRGSILENSRPSVDPSGSNMVKIQTSDKETFDTHSSEVTPNTSAVSVQSAASQFSTSDMQCNTSSKNVTLELHGESLVTSSAAEANDEEPLTSLDAELTSKETRPSPETSGSMNSTLTSLQPSQLSSSTNLSTTAQIPYPKNTTMDLPPSNGKHPKAESKATDLATSVSKNTTETSLVINQTFSAVKATGSSDMPNATIDGHTLHKSSSNTFLGDAAIVCLQNNTFDAKPKQNDTITFSETSSSDSCRNTFDKSTPLEFCNATSSPKEINSEAQTLDHKGTLSITDPNTKMVDTAESTFEVNPAVEVASGASQCETRDQLQSGLSLTGGLSDSPGHQNMDVENKANPFNLDESLDLRADTLITSTPMTTSKIVSMSIHEMYRNKTIVGQKKLYGDGASKPDSQFPLEVPSNITCERKTFLPHPAAKSILPPPRAASQLLRHKPASTTLSARFDGLTSGLPMTRQRTQALRNPTPPNTPQTSGIPCFSKLRASTTAATNPRTTTSQTKLSLSRGVLPVTKRKRMDAAVPASTAAETSCNAVSRPRALKQPASSHRALLTKTKAHDCANCVMLEQQLKMNSEEIQRLKEDSAKCVMLKQQLKMQTEEIRRLKEELMKKKDKAFKK